MESVSVLLVVSKEPELQNTTKPTDYTQQECQYKNYVDDWAGSIH
jgi:hypothetical protein